MKVLASDYDGTLLFNEKFKEGDLKKIKEFQKRVIYLVYVVEDLLKASMNFVSLILILISIFYVQEHLYLIKKEKLFIKVRFPKHLLHEFYDRYQKDYDIFIQANMQIYTF